jgi:opacity protein-like surface antigen
MTNHRVVAVFGWALLTVASAHAQDGQAQDRSRARPEITPFAFLGSDTSGGLGGAVRWALPARLSLELEGSYRRTDVAPLSTNVSLLFDLPDVGRVTPYLAAGVGLDQFAFADQSAPGPLVAQTGTGFAVNAGGGVRIRADENWGIRTDARWSNGIGRRAPERWRLYNGVTFKGK